MKIKINFVLFLNFCFTPLRKLDDYLSGADRNGDVVQFIKNFSQINIFAIALRS